jgi:hypothetical protein
VDGGRSRGEDVSIMHTPARATGDIEQCSASLSFSANFEFMMKCRQAFKGWTPHPVPTTIYLEFKDPRSGTMPLVDRYPLIRLGLLHRWRGHSFAGELLA